MAYNGSTPKLVVVVDGSVILPESVHITLTNKSESSNATVKIPLDNVDSKIFLSSGKVHTVEIWCGYIDETKDDITTGEDLIAQSKYKQYLKKRFDGFVDQPEWSIGMEGNYVTLTCKDLAGLLMDGKFAEKFEGSAVSAKNIIAKINGAIKGVSIEFKGADFTMGTKDKTGKKQVYNIGGKTYWDVIKDIAQEGNLSIYKNHRSIVIGPPQKTVNTWTMKKGPGKSQESTSSNFTNMNYRYGGKNTRAKDNVLVEVIAYTAAKKRTKSKGIIGRYPKNSKGWDGPENTELIRIVERGRPMTQKEADDRAERIAFEHLKGFSTGDVDIPFANPEMYVDDAITFVCEPENFGLKFLDGQVFRIDSITETFDKSGYKQSVEFEIDVHFKQPERKAPTNKDKKVLTKPPAYTVINNHKRIIPMYNIEN